MPAGRNVTRSVIGPALLVIVGAVLSYAAYNALRIGWADIYAAPAIRYLQARTGADLPLTELEWRSLEAALRSGSELAPANPGYLAHLGWLQQIRLTQDRVSLVTAELLSQGALASEYYRRAAAIRPTWPYDWGNLAIEEYRLGKYTSSEFSDALVRAVRFGPWEDDLQLFVAELGGDTFQFLSAEAQLAYVLNLSRALRRQAPTVIAIVNRYDVWGPVCEFLTAGGASGPSSDGEDDVGSAKGSSDELGALKLYCSQLRLTP